MQMKGANMRGKSTDSTAWANELPVLPTSGQLGTPTVRYAQPSALKEVGHQEGGKLEILDHTQTRLRDVCRAVLKPQVATSPRRCE